MIHSSCGRWTAAFFLASLLALGWVAADAQPEWVPFGLRAQAAGQPQTSGGMPEGQAEQTNAPAQPDGSGFAAFGQPNSDQPEELPAAYDFSQPAPEREAVDNLYFKDAAFIGDSRTDGFLIYSGIGQGKNLTSNGLSIFELGEKKALTIGGEKYTLLEALALEQYGKVYLSLGVNELGYYDDEGFYRGYCQAIDRIREIQPNAVIYVQGLIPLNEGVIAQTGGETYLTNEHLRVYNDLMRRAAEEKQVAFLDLYSGFADENGELPAEASRDGVHLRSDWCKQWLAYLQTHTVEFETLYPNGAPQVPSEEGQSDRSVEQ
ncbi:MAG: GDSL-type esterase/lipase family protein [Lawsonibacter sp.]